MDQRIKELAEQYACITETMTGVETEYIFDLDDLFEFAELIRQDEREQCAKLCDEKAKRDFNWASENADKYHAQASWAELCAKAIRARSKHE